MAQNKAITFRISETLLNRFKRALEIKGIDQTTFLLSKINEFCDEVERNMDVERTIEAFFCEPEEQHEFNGEIVSGCITYPVTITTEHSAASYGQPVVVIDGEPYGPGDMPPGELQIPANVYANLTPKLKQIGYSVCGTPVDDGWMESWENGIELDGRHWHPEARLVSF